MADRVCLLHQLRRLAEVGVRAGRIDQRPDFPPSNDRTREHSLARLTGSGQGFARQRRLIHFHLIAVQQAGIGRYNVAQPQADHISRHQFPRRRRDPFPIPFDPGLDRQLCLQRFDGVARLVFFPEADYRIGQQQKEDNEKIRPVPDNA